MTEPPDDNLKALLDKYAHKYVSLAKLAGLFLIWWEHNKTEQKISSWAKSKPMSPGPR